MNRYDKIIYFRQIGWKLILNPTDLVLVERVNNPDGLKIYGAFFYTPDIPEVIEASKTAVLEHISRFLNQFGISGKLSITGKEIYLNGLKTSIGLWISEPHYRLSNIFQPIPEGCSTQPSFQALANKMEDPLNLLEEDTWVPV